MAYLAGLVVDNNDPEKLGRVKVRLYGFHDDLKDKELPWALVAQPTTSAAFSGNGSSPTTLLKNSQVLCDYIDKEEQILMVFWTVAAKGDIAPEALGKAKSIKSSSKHEPKPKSKPQYPFNKTFKSESGHTIEIDDTKGSERLSIYHKSGSYINLEADGSIVIKSHKDSFNIIGGSSTIHVKGKQKLYVDGDANMTIKGNLSAKISGDMTTKSKKLVMFAPSITLTEVSTGLESLLSNELNILNKDGIAGILDSPLSRVGLDGLDSVIKEGGISSALDALSNGSFGELPTFTVPFLEKPTEVYKDITNKIGDVVSETRSISSSLKSIENLADITKEINSLPMVSTISSLRQKYDEFSDKIRTVKAKADVFVDKVNDITEDINYVKDFANQVKNIKSGGDLVNVLRNDLIFPYTETFLSKIDIIKEEALNTLKTIPLFKLATNEDILKYTNTYISIADQCDSFLDDIKTYGNKFNYFTDSLGLEDIKIDTSKIYDIQDKIAETTDPIYQAQYGYQKAIHDFSDFDNQVYAIPLSESFALKDFTTDSHYSSNLINHPDPKRVVNNLSNLASHIEIIAKKFTGLGIKTAYQDNQGSNGHYNGTAADLYWEDLSNYDVYNISKWIAENVPSRKLIFCHGEKSWLHFEVDEINNEDIDENMKADNIRLQTMVNGNFLEGLSYHDYI